MLERAERAVRARNHELALALSDELESNYPESRLHEERRAIRLMARCQAGLDGASQSSSFEQLYPGSVYADRIAHECDPAVGTRHDP